MGLGPRARIEVHRLFVRGFLDLGAQDLSQKLVWRKSKLPPAEASDGRSHEQCYLYRSTPLMLR